MLGSLEHEAEILTQILALKDDPVGFVFYAYPWGRPDTLFADLKGPRDWQLKELEAMGEHTRKNIFALENDLPMAVFKQATSSGRGPGKTALFGMAAHWHVSTRIGAPCIVSANTEAQMRTKTFPEFATWFGSAINAHWWVQETMRITPAPWLVEMVKKLPEEGGLGIDPRYWYVAGQTWSEDNPDSFAGAHNPYGMMLLFDEASGIPPPIWNVSEGFFTEKNPYRYWMAASQMRNRKGRFFELFNDPTVGKGWRLQTLTTQGMKGIDQGVVQSQIERYGIDSDFVRVEIMGLPPRTSEDQFIPWDAVRAAQQNSLYQDYGEPLILGVDPAPRGRTAWRFRQGRNARDCCGTATKGIWEGQDNVQIAASVVALNDKYNPDAICVDFGMGTGVIDILKRNPRIRGKLHEVKFGSSPHKKDGEFATHAAELWGLIRDWLPGAMIERDKGEKRSLSYQLTNRGWKWSGREENKKILETKEDLQSRGVPSPDDADALACTFEVNPPRRDDKQSRGPRVVEGTSAWMGES